MSIEVSLFLFGKPEWYRFESVKSSELAEEIRNVGASIGGHMKDAAKIAKKLVADAWTPYFGGGYSIGFNHNEVSTAKEARRRLRELKINPKNVSIEEFEDEDEMEVEVEVDSGK